MLIQMYRVGSDPSVTLQGVPIDETSELVEIPSTTVVSKTAILAKNGKDLETLLAAYLAKFSGDGKNQMAVLFQTKNRKLLTVFESPELRDTIDVGAAYAFTAICDQTLCGFPADFSTASAKVFPVGTVVYVDFDNLPKEETIDPIK